MLQVSFLRENKEKVLQGLGVRNFKDAEEQVDFIVNLDDQRKQLQQQNDEVLSKAIERRDNGVTCRTALAVPVGEIRDRRGRVAVEYEAGHEDPGDQ